MEFPGGLVVKDSAFVTAAAQVTAAAWVQSLAQEFCMPEAQPNKTKKRSRVNLKNSISGVPVVAQWLTNPTSIHEDAGSIPSLHQ